MNRVRVKYKYYEDKPSHPSYKLMTVMLDVQIAPDGIYNYGAVRTKLENIGAELVQNYVGVDWFHVLENKE